MKRAIDAIRSGKWNALTRTEWLAAADEMERSCTTEPVPAATPFGWPALVESTPAKNGRHLTPIEAALLDLVEEKIRLSVDAKDVEFWTRHREALR